MSPKLLASGSKILASRVFQSVLNAITGWMIAKTLGPAGQGNYSLIITLTMFFSALFNGGLGLSAVPILRQGKASLNNIIRSQLLWTFICGIILSLLYITIANLGLPAFAGVDFVFDSSLAILILAGILVLLLFDLLFYSLIASGRVVIGPIANLLRASIHLTLLLFVVSQFTLKYALSAWVIAQSTAVLVLLFVVFNIKDNKPAPTQSLFLLTRKLLKSGWVGQLSTLASMLHLRMNLALIALFYSSVETGIYSIAVLSGEFLWLLSGSLQPIVAWSAADADNLDRDQVTARAVRVALLATLSAAIVMGLVAKPLFSILFNNAYNESVVPLYCLLPGIVVFSVGAVLAGDFIGRGKPEWNTQASFLTLAVNLVLALIFVPKLGIIAASISSSIAYIVGSLFMMYRFGIVSKISISDLFCFKLSDFRRNNITP
jgi:O-antigen/teichoic acid export membrane protein